MRKKIRVACIQNNAGEDWQKNLQVVRRYVREAIHRKVQFIALPETFYFRGSSKQLDHLASKVTPVVIREFCELARRHRVAFLLGSLMEPSSQKERYYNTSILISETGRIAARYRKIHLFDVCLKGKVKTEESRHMMPGRKIVSATVWGIRTGLTVCYDLRFPELFRRLVQEGSQIIFVPSNFTETTGEVHWETLLKARAIENQVFIVAPGQVGTHPATRITSFGTSLVIDPWGKVLARGDRKKEEIITASLDLGFLKSLRKAFPVLKHRRFLS